MDNNIHLPSAKAMISTAASAAATTMLIRSFAREYIPHELTQYFYKKFHHCLAAFTNDITLTVDEYDGLNKNQLFYAAELYIAAIIAPSTKRIRASLPEKEHKINISAGESEDVVDQFHGLQLTWKMVIQQTQQRHVPRPDRFGSHYKCDVRYLELTFHKKHRNRVIDEYLPYILERSKEIKQGKKTLKLHTLRSNDGFCGPGIAPWEAVNLDHPAKFETLAMDDEIKETIMDDLERFVKRKEFYRKVGKAWKRGYLLYGPPGTGKSSLIAAMANYLNFDVYDLELTDVHCNSDLRKLLISTANRSILVVEDIDASIDLSERTGSDPNPPPQFYHYPHNEGNRVTLSGVLNFIDGLWSSCGDERIIVFTTNHKDKLDPALLRPGRMDMHIHMSYCTPCGFKMLAKNYTGIADHPLVSEAAELIASKKVTPAEVGEQLLKSEDPGLALRGLINFLEAKKDESREIKTKDDGLKELIEKAEGLSKAGMVNKDEAVNALKSLIRHLEGEAVIQDNNGSDKVQNLP